MESQRSLRRLSLGLLLPGSFALAVAKSPAKPVPAAVKAKPQADHCTLHTELDARTGRLFIPSSMPFRFSISGGLEGAEGFPLEKTDEKPEKALYFAEGEHNISIPSTIKQVYRFLADANPPETQFIIPEVPNYQKAGHTYYGKGMVLTLNTVDPVTGVDKTFVSLNDPGYKVFTEKQIRFPSDGSFALRYFSCDRVGNRESVHSLDFRVDVSAPKSSLQVKNNRGNPVLGPAAQLALKSLDSGAGVASINYKIDEGKFTTYESEILLADLKPGKHTLSYYAVDVLGNQEVTKVYNFSFDPNPPEISVAYEGSKFPDNDITYVADTTLTRLVAADKDSSVLRSNAWVNDKPAAIKDGVIALPGIEGLMNLKLLVYDAAGNESRLESKVFLDKTPPLVDAEILGPSFKEGESLIAPVPLRIRLRGQDSGSGIAGLSYCLNDAPCLPYLDIIEVKTPGPLTLSFQAQDRVDHLSEKHSLHFMLKDNQGVAAIPSTEKKLWVSDAKAGAIGPKAKRYRLEIADGPGDDARRFAISIPIDALEKIDQESMQNLVLSAGGYQADIHIPIDDDKPLSQHSFADAASFKKADVQYFGPGLSISLDAAEPTQHAQSGVKQIFQSINGSSFAAYKEPLKSFLAEQNYTLRYYSVDRVGNREDEHKVEFMLDMTPPKSKSEFTAPFFRNFLARTGGITLSAEDALAGVKDTFFALDEQEFKNYEPNGMKQGLAGLKTGAHKVHYYSVDQVGNREATQTLEFYIDDEGPQISHQIMGPAFQDGDLAYINKGAKFTLQNKDRGAGIEQMFYQIGKDAEQVYKGPVEIKDFGKETRFAYRAVDKVKNPGNSRTMTVRLDDSPPRSKLSFQGPYYIFDDKIYVKGSTEISIASQDDDSGVARIFYRINSNDYMPFQKNMKFDEHGEYSFSLYAVDKVGNRETPQVYRVIVDNDKPSLQIKTREGTPVLSDTVLPKGTLIYVSAYDSQAGVKDIYYRLGAGPPRLYRQPIRLTQSGPVTLEVKASDWMGEEETKSLTWRVDP